MLWKDNYHIHDSYLAHWEEEKGGRHQNEAQPAAEEPRGGGGRRPYYTQTDAEGAVQQ